MLDFLSMASSSDIYPEKDNFQSVSVAPSSIVPSNQGFQTEENSVSQSLDIHKTPETSALQHESVTAANTYHDDSETSINSIDQMIEALSAFSHAGDGDFEDGGALGARKRRKLTMEEMFFLLSMLPDIMEDDESIRRMGEWSDEEEDKASLSLGKYF